MHKTPWLGVVALTLPALVCAGACGSSASNHSGFDGGSGDDASVAGDGAGVDGMSLLGDGHTADAPLTGCTNLQCQVHSCSGGGSTTITGRVTDPAGKNPLYNVVVYVPNSAGGALAPIPLGVNASSCSCGALFSGQPIVATVTAADGTFTLANVPDGADIPLVVQIGKWRKEVVLPKVSQCKATAAGDIALPRNGSDGKYASLPSIAVSTGGADRLQCLLVRAGVDMKEFTGNPASATSHVHVFQGTGGDSTVSPPSPSSPMALWDTTADLERYDIVLLSCEGNPTAGVTAASAPVLADYVNAGGRVFAEHYHYAFFTAYDKSPGEPYPQFAHVATWNNVGTSANDIYAVPVSGDVQTKLPSGQAFPEGAALKAWLGKVGALTGGELPIPTPNGRFNAVIGKGDVATPWVQTATSAPAQSTQYFSWDMPFQAPVNDAGVPAYCGRVVYSDLHVSGSHVDQGPVPTGCASGSLSPDEDALEFILFDLSSCVTPAGSTPMPPMGAQ